MRGFKVEEGVNNPLPPPLLWDIYEWNSELILPTHLVICCVDGGLEHVGFFLPMGGRATHHTN